MQLGFSQQMKMSQQMKLAPRMIQSMEILQLPLMALKERIDQELSENPLLEEPAVEPTVQDSSESDRDSTGADLAGDGAGDGDGGELRVEKAEKPLEQKELVVDS